MAHSHERFSPNTLPVLCIHGLFGTLDDPRIRAACPKRTWLAPPLLGYGPAADKTSEPVTIKSQAGHLFGRAKRALGAMPFHVVAHSIGGVIAAVIVDEHPQYVASFTSIEGNFTLRDAFWSLAISEMEDEQVDALLQQYRAEPIAWLALSGIVPGARAIARARSYLEAAHGRIIRAIAASVVEETSSPAYGARLKRIFDRTPVHLVAGERSRGAWDVPDWALRGAATHQVLPDTGHMLMMENPRGLGRLLAAALGGSATRSRQSDNRTEGRV